MKRKYNIIATIQQGGRTSRKVCPIGELTQDGITDLVLAYCIIDYSNALIKEIEENNYRVVSTEEGDNLSYRKLILDDGSDIVITAEEEKPD